MTAAYLGQPRRRQQPEPPRPGQVESLSASERSHRQRLVREARAAVQIVDDPVKRLLTRRELAEELDEPAHHDSVAPEARDAIARLVGKRRRLAPPPEPAVEPPAEPAEVVMPDPAPLPDPPKPREPVLPPHEPIGVPTAADIAALARARRAEVAAGDAVVDELAADDGAFDIARLLSRRNGA